MDRVLLSIIICFILVAFILNSCANTGIFAPGATAAIETATHGTVSTEPVGAAPTETGLSEGGAVGTEDSDLSVTPVIITQTVPFTVPVFVTQTPPPPVACAETDPALADEIRIGALVPLSGESAFLSGFGMQTAFNIAAYNLNSAGGILNKPVRLIVGDTRGDAEVGHSLAERMITQDCVVGLVGVYHSRVARAVKEVAHEYNIPTIFSEPFDDSITADYYPEIFRLAPTLSMIVSSDEAWLSEVGDYNGDGIESVAFVTDPNSYGSTRFETLAQRLAEKSVETATISTELPMPNVSGAVQRIAILAHRPDVIIIGFNGAESLQLQSELSAAGLNPNAGTLIVNKQIALDSTQFWGQLPDGTYTLVDRIGPWYATVGELGRGFAASYQQLMQSWPPSYAFAAHDALYLMGAAIESAESLAPTDVITSLESIDVELASGRYYFPYNEANPPDGDEVPAYMWHQWPDPPTLLLQYTEQGQNSTEMSVVWPAVYSTEEVPFVVPSDAAVSK